MAATRTRTESVSASRDGSAISKSEGETPTRRTTTRTRKLPSRLQPSPSPPPPARPLLNQTKSTSRDPVTPMAVLPATPTVVIIQSQYPKTKRPQSKSDSPSHGLETNSTPSEHDLIDKDVDASVDDLGPGKRKRRPSSMYRPPSTLTTVEASQPTPLSSTKSKKKGRSTSPDSVTKSASAHTLVTYGKNRHRKSNSLRHAGPDADPSEANLADSYAHDSEMEHEPVLASRESKRIRQSDVQDASDLAPPPLLPRDGSVRCQMPAELTLPTFTRGGQVSVSPESGHKRARMLIKPCQRRETDSALTQLRLSDEARSSKLDTRSLWRPTDGLSSSPQSPLVSRFDHCSLSRPDFSAAVHSTSSARTHLRQNNVSFDMVDDEEEDEDEDDFHQAMLDADLDFFESQKSELVSVDSWLLAETHASDHEMDDTPATTPRSPQSGCDPSTPGSPATKTESLADEVSTEKANFATARDTVFVHALPTTQVGANKPHQHAGSLTLSLPYSPEVAASSPHLKAADVEQDAKASVEVKPNARLSTPILQRRKHPVSLMSAHGLGSLKFASEGVERLGASHFMQLSPMIELDSPLLSPGLSLGLHGKGATDPPSPFAIGVSALPDLDQPAPLALPPSQGALSSAKDAETKIKAAITESRLPTQPKHEMVALKRPALPPPRQIRFTTFTTTDIPTSKVQPQPDALRPTMTTSRTRPVVADKVATRSSVSTTDETPDLIYSGSSSPESAAESASPSARSDSDSHADSEVENILFGPPEKLDLGELDQVWGGSKAGLSGLAATAGESSSAVLRRTNAPRIQRVGLA